MLVAASCWPGLANVMVLGQCLGQWMVVGYEEQGAISKSSIGKAINDFDDTCANEILPSMGRSNGLLICQAKALDPPQGIVLTIRA